jgi:hypothetical protein
VTYPVPDRLAPVRAEVHRRKAAAMLAVLAAIVFAIKLFHGHVFDVDLTVLGLFLLSLHFVWTVALPLPRRRV